MELALETLSAKKYKARPVTFHLPDFIDIVVNAGDDRKAFGATIGQSLPNWGPVANEGRGRTVAVTNLYSDQESLSRSRERVSTLYSNESIAHYAHDATGGLLSTILHEATHNLGPAHEYRFRKKTAKQAFGGSLASMLEELKAQSGALFYLEMLRERGVIDEELQKRSYVDAIAWSFGHISRGMYTASGQGRPYSQLAAIQLGFLMDAGAVSFDSEALAANAKDKGAFTVHLERMPKTVSALMKKVLLIKATNDARAAKKLVAEYVDGDKIPQKLIAERFLRFPKASFVYGVTLK